MTKTSEAFAWWDEEKKEFCHVYSSKFCVKMCFPDEGKNETELGLGTKKPHNGYTIYILKRRNKYDG